MRTSSRFAGDAKDPCLECGESTVMGSGNFINRVPAFGYGEDMTYGWLCPVCTETDWENEPNDNKAWCDTQVLSEHDRGLLQDIVNSLEARHTDGVS